MIKAFQEGAEFNLPGGNIPNNLQGNPRNIGKGTPIRCRLAQGEIT